MQRKPITIDRIDAETNGKVILPREHERVRSIKMIEEGIPAVPVFRGYRNAEPIKEKIHNEEIETTIEGKTRKLTKDSKLNK